MVVVVCVGGHCKFNLFGVLSGLNYKSRGCTEQSLMTFQIIIEKFLDPER